MDIPVRLCDMNNHIKSEALPTAPPEMAEFD